MEKFSCYICLELLNVNLDWNNKYENYTIRIKRQRNQKLIIQPIYEVTLFNTSLLFVLNCLYTNLPSSQQLM